MIFEPIEVENSDYAYGKNLRYSSINDLIRLISSENLGSDFDFVDFFVFDDRAKEDVRLRPIALMMDNFSKKDLNVDVTELINRDYEIIKKPLISTINDLLNSGLDFYIDDIALRFCEPSFLEKTKFLENDDYQHLLLDDELTVIGKNKMIPSFDDNMIAMVITEDKDAAEAFYRLQLGSDNPELYEQELD